MIIELKNNPFCTREGLRAVRGQIDMLVDMGMKSVASNMAHMADDLEHVLNRIEADKHTGWQRRAFP
jgi:hypothetical protein